MVEERDEASIWKGEDRGRGSCERNTVEFKAGVKLKTHKQCLAYPRRIVIDSLSMWAFMGAVRSLTKGVRVRWLSPANRLVLGLLFGYFKTMGAYYVMGETSLYYASFINLVISMVLSFAALAYNDGPLRSLRGTTRAGVLPPFSVMGIPISILHPHEMVDQLVPWISGKHPGGPGLGGIPLLLAWLRWSVSLFSLSLSLSLSPSLSRGP